MKILFVLGLLIVLASCATVKEYQKMNINDPDMVLTGTKMERYETAFQVYREAAAGANGGNTGGGCGCN